MIKILIADDHAVVREGIKQILSGTSDIVVAAEASNGQEVLDKIGEDNFDLIILDITMPGINGLDALKEIKVLKPKLPVLILSMYPEEQYAMRVLEAGASGYLSKECVADDLIRAIKQISRGERYIGLSCKK